MLKQASVSEVLPASGYLHDVLYERVGGYYGGVRIRYAKDEKNSAQAGRLPTQCNRFTRLPFSS